MRILFLSHSFPPIVGGVESQNYNLSKNLGASADVTIIANTKGKVVLPFFLLYTLARSLFAMTKNDVCLCGNGVLAPVAAALKFFHQKKRFYCIVHGLDITYADRSGFLPFIYRNINVPSLKKMNRIFTVGEATIEELFRHNIPRDLCKFIPNGVTPEDLRKKHTRKDLEELLGINIENKKVVLRLGRFVPHKGTSWFIENVVPSLPESTLFVAAGNRVSKNTAGDKDDFAICEKLIKEKRLEKKVLLLPSIPWDSVKVLLNTADLVVAPNIKVPGTMEGFGINVIEAGVCDRVVLASNLEGLASAIKNGENGILVEPGDAEQWKKKIKAVLEAGDDFAEEFGKKTGAYVMKNLTWKAVAEKYLEQMKK